MTTKEKVEQIEKTFAVESLKVNRNGKTFEIYPWIKGRLFHKMITGSEAMYTRTFSLYWKQFISVFYGVHNIFRRYDVWIFSSSVERRPIEGKQEDKLFDFIGNKVKGKALLIELRLFKYFKRSSVASQYPISKSFFLLFETIYSKLFLRNISVENSEVLTEITENVEGGIDVNWIVRKYLAQYSLMKFWLKILPNPKLVCLSVGYTSFGYIRAFKEAGIEVVEFQHGIISKNHHAYFYVKSFDSIQFPDVLLTTGKQEVSVFDDENKFPICEVTPVGSRIIQYYWDKRKVRSHLKPIVLFALQDGVMSNKLLHFIYELNEKYSEEIEVIVQPRRTQKGEYQTQLPFVKDLNFSKQDFYSAVVQSDFHSTVYSTTAIEALSLGVPNILVNIDNQSREQLGLKLAGNEFTKIVETTDQFMEALRNFSEISIEEIRESNSSNIQPNFHFNIVEFFKNRVDVEQ